MDESSFIQKTKKTVTGGTRSGLFVLIRMFVKQNILFDRLGMVKGNKSRPQGDTKPTKSG